MVKLKKKLNRLNLIKKFLVVTGILFIAIQFIRPSHNKKEQVLSDDISKVVMVPDSIQSILKNSCYDCHSNNTRYPWYSNIQPVYWFMNNDIKKGKKELNFDEFGSYSPRRQLSKLSGIENAITEEIMPLSSYLLMHNTAKLSPNEKTMLIKWAQQSADSLSANE